MAATLRSEMDNSDRVVVLINECRRMGIRVLPPNLNEGEEGFRATSRGDIQFGLSAIKNVGVAAIRSIIRARREHGAFEDIFELASRVDLRLVNRRVLESLVAAGALDGMHGHRAQLAAAVPAALELGQRTQRERESGQTSLLGSLESTEVGRTQPRKLPESEPWADGVALAREKEVLGLYITGHPLARYERELRVFATAAVADITEMEDEEPVRIGGIITNLKITNDRKGERMAFVTIEDFTGRIEVVVFSSTYARRREEVRRDVAVIVEGKVSTREDEVPKIVLSDIVPLTLAYQRFVERVVVRLPADGLEETTLALLRDLLLDHSGVCPVDLVVPAGDHGSVTIDAVGTRVLPSRHLVEALDELLGASNVELVGPQTGARTPDPGF
jgi:DNA polymerase-3 subunit alpha